MAFINQRVDSLLNMLNNLEIPQKLTIIPDFISKEEEIEILKNIKSIPNNKGGRNSIQRYGSALPYNDHVISKEIPWYLDILCNKLINSNLTWIKPDSVTINEYLKGQSIPTHIDSPESGLVITVLSLLSDSSIVFHRKANKFSIQLPVRSLMQMSGEIRDKWFHYPEPAKNKRYSIVFRCSK